MGILNDVQEHTQQGKKLLAAIHQAMEALPDNPRIKRMEGSANAFVIMSSDLGPSSVMSAEYHDFHFMYQIILQALEGGDIQNVGTKLQEIVSQGKVRVGGYTYPIHPDVIANIQTIL